MKDLFSPLEACFFEQLFENYQEGRVSLKKSKYHLVIYHTLLQSTSQLNLLYFYQAECMRGKVTGLVS